MINCKKADYTFREKKDRFLKKRNPRKRKKLRILFIVNVISIGGSEVFLLKKIRELRKMGHIAVLAFSEKKGTTIGKHLKLLLEGKQIHKITFNYRSIKPLLKKYKVKIVHTVQANPKYLKAAKEIDPNIICVSTQTATTWDADRNFDHKRYTDAFIIKTDNFKRIIKKRISKLPRQIKIIPNGVDCSAAEGKERRKDDLFKYLNVKNGKKIILQIGRIHEIKNTYGALLIAKKTINKQNNVAFVHVGGRQDEEKKYYKKLMGAKKRYKLNKNYIFLGEKVNIRRLINIADCILNTTITHEGTSNALLEGMAGGKPIVAYKCLGINEIIKNGITGYLVEKNNAELVAKKIVKIINNNKLAGKLGKNAKDYVKKNFSLKKSVGMYEKVYYKLIKKNLC